MFIFQVDRYLLLLQLLLYFLTTYVVHICADLIVQPESTRIEDSFGGNNQEQLHDSIPSSSSLSSVSSLPSLSLLPTINHGGSAATQTATVKHSNQVQESMQNLPSESSLALDIAQLLTSSDGSIVAAMKRSDVSFGGVLWKDLAVSTSSASPLSSIGDDYIEGNDAKTAPKSSPSTPSSLHDGLEGDNIHNYIVQPCSGVLANGKVCGVIGPSGSGKTTFLSAIAGLLPSSAVDGWTGKYCNSSSNGGIQKRQLLLEPIQTHQVGWLQQHDDFFSQLTVRETLALAAFLELPNAPLAVRHSILHKTASSLGLHGALDRKLGHYSDVTYFRGLHKAGKQQSDNNKNRSNPISQKKLVHGGRLSGGERRRVSLALELLRDQQMLFIADEPTTGLDSRMSSVVMNLIHKLASDRNIPAFCSLHQPRSSIWQQLDSILLLAPGGKVCFFGERSEVIPYFQRLGHTLPKDTNPAEFLIDLVSIDSEDETTARADVHRINTLAKAFRNHQTTQYLDALSSAKKLEVVMTNTCNHHGSDSSYQINKPVFFWLRRTGALFQRAWRQSKRDVKLNLTVLLSHIMNGLLLVGIFPTVRRGQIPSVVSIADRVALLSFSVINLGMMSYSKTVASFSREKPVTQRERQKELYSSHEYLLAKTLAEIPVDCLYSLALTAVMKFSSGIIISWKALSITYGLMTTASASLGFLIGSVADSEKSAQVIGIPILVILMAVGVINPSGVDVNSPHPFAVQILKLFSPFAYAIEALCLGEYPGVIFQTIHPSLPTSTGGRLTMIKARVSEFLSRLSKIPRMGGLALITSGDQVIEALGLNGKTITRVWLNLGIVTAGNFLATWMSLTIQHHWSRFSRRGRHQQQSPKSPKEEIVHLSSKQSLSESPTKDLRNKNVPLVTRM